MRFLIPLVSFVTMMLWSTISESQVSCWQYQGGMTSCNTPRGNTTIAPLGDANHGVITRHGDGQNSLDAYTINPAPSTSRDLNHFIEPLRPLPTFQEREREMNNGMVPSLPGPLLLGE